MSSDKSLTIVVLGLLPPPVTGAAKNNLLLYESLIKQGFDAVAIQTSAGGIALSRSLGYHAARMWRFAKSTAKLLAVRRRSGTRRLYFVPDGGLGVWYSLGYVMAAGWIFHDVIIHHRTFQYIDNHSSAMARICRMLDGKVTHVFLSEGMRDKFQAQYGNQPSLVSTNARYVTPRQPAKPTNELVIGHLSNLCQAKGYYEVAETFEALVAAGKPVRLLLAGPAIEQGVEEHLNDLLSRYPSQVEWYGEVGGATKDAFYDRLHVFLFPTKWSQEAQPNVIYEAFAGGAQVVAFDRGCIGEMIPPGTGVAFLQDVDFVKSTMEHLNTSPTDVGRIYEVVTEQKMASTSEENVLMRMLCALRPAQ